MSIMASPNRSINTDAQVRPLAPLALGLVAGYLQR
jgi:hypothetical protein